MERSDYKSCMSNEQIYPHDSEVCTGSSCMICNDGNWQETKDLFPPKKSGILSP